MQRIIIVMLLFLNTSSVNGQTSDEWLRQNQTGIGYQIEQIGALQTYSEAMNKGYAIAHSGLTHVFTSKGEDYWQHSNYFLSLWKVKTGIKNYSKVLSILDMKSDIEKQYRLITTSAIELLNDKERSYVNSVYASLLSGCKDLSDDVDMVISDDQLQLKDDERIQRIEKIYLQMQDRYQFSRSFATEIRLLVLSRLKERSEGNKLSSLYGMK